MMSEESDISERQACRMMIEALKNSLENTSVMHAARYIKSTEYKVWKRLNLREGIKSIVTKNGRYLWKWKR